VPNKTFTSATLTAADTNTYLSHTGDAWVSYTPTLTNITLGNGTLVGDYWRAGRGIFFKVKLTFGSTTSVSGAMTIGLPVAYADGTDAEVFAALLYDASANARYPAKAQAISTTTVAVNAINSSATYLTESSTSSTVPFTWTTSDILIVAGFYESAS
jgi:hypothetical protein